MVPVNSKPMSKVISDTTRSAVPGSVKYTNSADITMIVIVIRNQARPASGFIDLHQMTSYFAAPVGFLERWHNFFTHLAHKGWATGMERTTGWQLQ